MCISKPFPHGLRLFLLFISFIEIAGTINLWPQTYFFDNYGTQQEFESKVYSIAQDKQHYVWLGTQTGVSKFDGITFVSYSLEDGLAEGSVRVLFIDGANILWLGHEGGGITRFNGKTFERISMLDSLLRSNITSINQDADNQVWITTESDGALMIRNPHDPVALLKYEHYLKGKSLGDQVFNSLVTSEGNLYFITNVGIRKYNKTGNSFESYTPKGMSTYFSISVMFEDSKSNLWFGTYNGGLSKMIPKENKFQDYNTQNGLASNWITSITEDRSGNIWIGHWKDDSNTGGISRIDPSGKITVFNTSNGLHDDHIWCIKEDAEGNILIGTTEQGLDIFKDERFVSYSIQDGLLHNQVNAITEDTDGQIWFGTNLGISVYTGTDKTASFRHFNQSNKFISNQIRYLRKDKNKNIWIGTADQGVMFYNTARKQFIAKPQINSYIPYQILSNGITALEIGGEGHLWIGTLDGLVEYDIINDSYVATHTQQSGLAGNQITALYTDSEGDLWIGSDKKKGLTRLHQGKFSIIKNFSELTPTCIVEDKEHKIWVGTELKGVMLLNKDSVIHYGTAEGLLSNLISLLVCDDNNNIFVGTNRGLNKIDRKSNKILSYTRRVGFTGIETNNNAWCFDDKDFLWVGTANGAIRCDLSLLSIEDPIEPAVQVSEMLVNGMQSKMAAGMRLPSNKNDITFRYISISLKNPEGIIYQVMLEGLQDTWQDMKNENTIAFNKLQPGRYTFKVKAKNDQGVWSSDPAIYSFRVLAPFYQRGYFIVSVVCIILAFFIGYIKIRERNLIQEKKILEDSVNERTRALSVAIDELSRRNQDITDSITYAKRIQLAILPPDIPFDNTFIFYKPKDIVSGDFYWMNAAGGKEFLAAVDCTGHGVPGAFMSFIGFTSLNKIIIEQGIYKPSAILNRLNEEVATTLHQKGEDIVTDGMDIALMCYSPATGILEYSGAYNPLIIIRKGELIETKADRFAIGRAAGKEKIFTNHELQLETGDTLYLYSDGYADQFGGPEGKKFKTSALKELLINISEFDSDSQQKILESAFEDWKGNQEQIDDVLVVGRKF
jgi:ligand-binding sensor domain-containing protein/serine phosphatase RsbU (regulator of sigma subunit)